MQFVDIGPLSPRAGATPVVRFDLSSTGEDYPDEWPLETRSIVLGLARSWGGLALTLVLGIYMASAIANLSRWPKDRVVAQHSEPVQTGAISSEDAMRAQSRKADGGPARWHAGANDPRP